MILGIYLNLVFRSQSFKFRFISYQHEIQEIYVRSLNSNTMPYTDMLPTVNLHFCSHLGCDVNTVFHVIRAPDPTVTWLLSRPLDARSNNSQATNYAPVRPARSGQIHAWVWKTLKFGQFESFWTCFNCLFVFFNEGLLSNWLLLTDAFNKWTDRRVARKLSLFFCFLPNYPACLRKVSHTGLRVWTGPH